MSPRYEGKPTSGANTAVAAKRGSFPMSSRAASGSSQARNAKLLPIRIVMPFETLDHHPAALHNPSTAACSSELVELPAVRSSFTTRARWYRSTLPYNPGIRITR
jgi:hypothetical protein